MASTNGVPQSRTAYVLERLRAEIDSGEINPGAALRQAELARRYGVSPTPVREALRILAASGTIDYHSHRGATVRDVTPEMAHDLYRMRAVMEGLACEIAVERITEEQLAAVDEANAKLEAAVAKGAPPARLSRLNKELHFAIYEGTSSLVVEAVQTLWSRFKPNVTLWSRDSFIAELSHDHEGIIEALHARDAEAARTLMHTHVMNAWSLRETDSDLRATGGTQPATPAQ